MIPLQCWPALWELHFSESPCGTKMQKFTWEGCWYVIVFVWSCISQTHSLWNLKFHLCTCVKLFLWQTPIFDIGQHTKSEVIEKKNPQTEILLLLWLLTPQRLFEYWKLGQKEPFTEVATNLLFIIAHSIFKSTFLSLTVIELFQKHEPIKHLPQSALNNSLKR